MKNLSLFKAEDIPPQVPYEMTGPHQCTTCKVKFATSEACPKTGPVKNIVFWSFTLSANCRGVKPPSEL